MKVEALGKEARERLNATDATAPMAQAMTRRMPRTGGRRSRAGLRVMISRRASLLDTVRRASACTSEVTIKASSPA